jgi:hypothetical protein
VAALQDDPANADLARILAAWDGRDDKELAAPLIYHKLYERLVWGRPMSTSWATSWRAPGWASGTRGRSVSTSW